MPDGRLQLVLVLALLYLSGSLVSPVLSWFSVLPAGNTAYLRSISPRQLVVESSPGVKKNIVYTEAIAHAPFFFQPIAINSADKELLMTVKGIGPALADALISHRQKNGPFKNSDDLAKIRGVGSKRAASIAPFLLFDEVP